MRFSSSTVGQRQSKVLIRRLYLSGLLIAMAMGAGVIGFMFIEHYKLLDAFYMTVITLSTVGFSEVKPMSDAGRMFASVLIIGNLGIFAYAISNISQFVIEGGLNQLFYTRHMERLLVK